MASEFCGPDMKTRNLCVEPVRLYASLCVCLCVCTVCVREYLIKESLLFDVTSLLYTAPDL